MEFYKKLSNGKTASAGTKVEDPGKLIKERPGSEMIIQAMMERGINIGDNPRTQLTESMLDDYDKVVVMAEPKTAPEWLADNPKVVFWDVIDIKDQPLETARELRDQILQKVEELLGTPDNKS
jgi:protein-tyrosine-phosphatase